MSSLKLNGLNKTFPSGETALYNINLEAEDNEFLVVLGADGSGKSTLLRIVAGLEDCTAGSVFIDGKDVTDADPKDRDIAMVFKSSTLYPALNVYDNIAFGLKIRKAPQALIDQRVKSAAAILGLTDSLYRKPKVLSAAVKQRVAIARAMVREPRVFLFDEPLSGLDENLRADLLNVIVNVQARMSGTFLYATKNLAEAMAIGTRIAVLKNGLLQQTDTPANLYDYPVNAYVAFLTGSPTINLLQGATVVKEQEGYFVNCGAIKLPLAKTIVKRFEKIDEYAANGAEIILGIRPEDAEAGKDGAIDAKVAQVESDGDKTYAECSIDGGKPVIVWGQSTLLKGEEVKISVNLNRLYLFDGQTRLTLLNRDGGYKNTGRADADFKPLTYAEEQEISEKSKPKAKNKKK